MSETIINKTKDYVRNLLSDDGSGHDWWHIYRVWNTAKLIGKKEGADMIVVELAALLHDVADRKFNEGDVKAGTAKVRKFLSSLKVKRQVADHVCEIVSTCSFATSFTGTGKRKQMKTLEGKVVQDADRLDAIGAIGTARTFAYGGSRNHPMYSPGSKPKKHMTTEEYVKGESHTINHFYEKLLLLKDLMNTGTAKRIAAKRHAFMEKFLDRFFKEWVGLM